MACRCSSPQKRAKIKKQMQRRLLETEQLKIALSMKGAVPKKLNDKQLLDYHKKSHMLYAGNINRKPVNKQFINMIVDLHNSFVAEMLKRKMNHKTPLNKV